MKVIALYSIKGGVGKTAACVNLAYLSAHEGLNTLLCDLDPQGSTSFYFRIRPRKKLSGKKLLKGGKHVDKNIRGTDFENLELLPATLSFRNLDLALQDRKHSKQRLSKILQPLSGEYDLIFLDCPPGISLLSENIFEAADFILVPVIPTTLSVLTVDKLLEFFKKRKLPRSKLLPFYSMVEQRKSLHKQVMQSSADLGALTAHIPYRADVEKMGLMRQPLMAFKSESGAATAYTALWQELKDRLK